MAGRASRTTPGRVSTSSATTSASARRPKLPAEARRGHHVPWCPTPHSLAASATSRAQATEHIPGGALSTHYPALADALLCRPALSCSGASFEAHSRCSRSHLAALLAPSAFAPATTLSRVLHVEHDRVARPTPIATVTMAPPVAPRRPRSRTRRTPTSAARTVAPAVARRQIRGLDLLTLEHLPVATRPAPSGAGAQGQAMHDQRDPSASTSARSTAPTPARGWSRSPSGRRKLEVLPSKARELAQMLLEIRLGRRGRRDPAPRCSVGGWPLAPAGRPDPDRDESRTPDC